MSIVKLRVRENALLLREFTVEEMVKATGFKPESVRTELQRMKKEKFLIAEPSHKPQHGRGGRLRIYKLTADPGKRLALSQQVRSFYPAPTTTPSGSPTSGHYTLAQRLLERVKAGEYEHDEQRNAFLKRAGEALDFAWHEEGTPKGSIEAFINFERARIEYISGKFNEAKKLFDQAKSAFVVAGLSDEAGEAAAWTVCASLQAVMHAKSNASPESRVRVALDVLHNVDLTHWSGQPLLEMLVKLVGDMTARAQVLAKALTPVVKAPEPIPSPVDKLGRREQHPRYVPASKVIGGGWAHETFRTERDRLSTAQYHVRESSRMRAGALVSVQELIGTKGEASDLSKILNPRFPFAMTEELQRQSARRRRNR